MPKSMIPDDLSEAVSVRVRPSELEALKRQAAENERSVSAQIRWIVGRYFDDMAASGER